MASKIDNPFNGYAGFDGKGGFHGKGGHGGNQIIIKERPKPKFVNMNRTATTIGANYDFASEISSRASDLQSKNLKNYQNFGNYRTHGNQNLQNVLTMVDQPNKPLVPQNKFYTNREQRAFSFYQEHNT